MTQYRPPDPSAGKAADRDRALARVTRLTAVGGVGAIVATGALAGFLSQPAHAKPGSTATSSGSSSSSSSSSSDDGGLQSSGQAPGSSGSGSSGSGNSQPQVSSGGS
jgi:hypothetical protein